MNNNKNISKLVNMISNRTLEEEVKRVFDCVELSTKPSLIMGYCASNNETFDNVTDYLLKELSLSKNNYIEIGLTPEMRNLRGYISDNKHILQKNQNEVMMFKVKGFEQLNGFDIKESDYYLRVAHDYDQESIEKLNEDFPDLNKKIVIITHIGHSAGQKNYDKAVRSACQSQFKTFLYEFA